VILKDGHRKPVLEGGTYPRYVPSGHLVYVHDGTLFATLFDLDKLEVVAQPIPILNEIHAELKGGAEFAFSNEGALVYQKGGRSNDVILKWVSRDGEATRLEDDPANYRDLFLSPDGKRLARTMASSGTFGWDVWVFDLERDIRTRLTVDPGYDGSPVWTPDGQYIVFGSGREGAANLYRKRADGTGKVERLTESSNTQSPSSVSPDGKIAFTESASDTSQTSGRWGSTETGLRSSCKHASARAGFRFLRTDASSPINPVSPGGTKSTLFLFQRKGVDGKFRRAEARDPFGRAQIKSSSIGPTTRS